MAHVVGSEPHELRDWPPTFDSHAHAREVLERACADAGIEDVRFARSKRPEPARCITTALSAINPTRAPERTGRYLRSGDRVRGVSLQARWSYLAPMPCHAYRGRAQITRVGLSDDVHVARERARDLDFPDDPVRLPDTAGDRARAGCMIEMDLTRRAYATACLPTSGVAGRPGP